MRYVFMASLIALSLVTSSARSECLICEMNRVVKDVGRSIEKGVHDTGGVIEKKQMNDVGKIGGSPCRGDLTIEISAPKPWPKPC